MSVLMLTEVFPPRTGGSGRWFWELYRRLPREDFVVMAGEDPRQDAFDRTHDFYERHGGFTIVAARFMPFLRTFAPFVAGVAKMNRARFAFFDVTGGVLWVAGIITVGYFFGNIPFVKANLDKIIWAMIFIPGLIILLGAWRSKHKQRHRRKQG